ncbi:MAG: hypothetical protein KDD04_06855, partial [Sinomicrobium sp.]|nr:hypothetical protein [Sinomicrobium sp.]
NGVWSGLPAFAEAFTDFENIINRIHEAQAIQVGRITGVTADKLQLQETLIAHTIRIAKAVYAYASATGNNALKGQVDYSPSALKKKRDTELLQRCQAVYNAANDHIGSLGNYGVDAGMLAELQNELGDFEDALSSPREAIVTRAEATARLAEWFKQGDVIVKERMDPLTEMFKDDGAFYSLYHKARIIVDV